MGFYINPKNETKEQWLLKHGQMILSLAEAKWLFEGEKYLPVVLMDNGIFTAAGIAYCKEELEAFSEPDPRRKSYFKVSKKDLFKVCPKLETLFSM